MKRRLIVSDGQRERELLLVGTIVVGRDPGCDISEDGDSLLSRRHTEFVANAEGVVVRDLGSRNGTFVNGVKIAESSIRAGDVVHIGHLRVRYVEDGGKPVGPVTTVVPSGEDEEVTRIVQGAQSSPFRPEPRAVPPGKPSDDDRTVVTPRPDPAPGRLPPRPAADDERTMLVAAGAARRPETNAAAQDVRSAPLGRTDETHASMLQELRIFVFLQIAVVAAVIFTAVGVALVLGRSGVFGETAGILVLILPVAAASIATFVVGTLINRRIGLILTADKEEGRGV